MYTTICQIIGITGTQLAQLRVQQLPSIINDENCFILVEFAAIMVITTPSETTSCGVRVGSTTL